MQAPAGPHKKASVSLSEPQTILLSTLESARDLFSRTLVREYHAVTDPDLNFVSVSSILQILFLKTGQEYGIIEPGTLAALAACNEIPERLARACTDAGLDPDRFFEKGPEGARALSVLSDKPLREIIRGTDSPEFPVPPSRIPLEEFAAVLELFLGMRVQADDGSRVKRAPKSAMHYTGSVHIPPQQVIGYIAGRIGNRPECRTAPDNEPVIRILDPACGAGLFLLAAYRNHVRNITRMSCRCGGVTDNSPGPAGLPVFGTDIDPESVSAARTVLLFAFIEERMKASMEKPSPDRIREICECLTRTIRCGNALIAPDYFLGKPVFPFNAGERRKVNALDWTAVFPDIPGGGGFDAVIGAPPPYRPFAVPAREEYFQTHYDTYAPSAGLYGYFIERGLSLLKPGGSMMVLVPGTFLRSHAARPLRRLLLRYRIDTIANTKTNRILADGDVDMYLIALKNQPAGRQGIDVQEWDYAGIPPGHGNNGKTFRFDQRSLDDGGWILGDTRTADILAKLRAAGTPLDQYVMGEIAAGAIPVRNNPLVIDTAARNRLIKKAWWCRRFVRPLLRPSDIARYRPVRPERFVIHVPDNRGARKCRALVQYLEVKAREQREPTPEPGSGVRPVPAGGLFGICQEPEEYRPKIVCAEFQKVPAFLFDPEGTFAIASSLVAVFRNNPFLAGILNSSLGRFVVTQICPPTDRGYHTSPAALGKFPVYVPDFDRLSDKARHDKLVSLVTHILELNRYLPQATTDQERRLVQQEIDATDVRIDAQVYELYGLTPDEIAVIEGNTG